MSDRDDTTGFVVTNPLTDRLGSIDAMEGGTDLAAKYQVIHVSRVLVQAPDRLL